MIMASQQYDVLQSEAMNGTAAVCDNTECISIVSYNMHGYNQGAPTVRDLMLSIKPDVFVLQEHWLTPAKLSMFENDFPQYMCFGSSAMSSCVESGVVRGRPFGGVMTLVNKKVEFMLQNYLCIRSLCYCNCRKLINSERLYAVFRDSQQNLCF